ncbi:hypothetical protein [Aureimonas leprariae]|uniref:Antifreeze protein n=1 Tax=Plantimonas leprariae TaxID=2615207 RepID=A0A7V7PPC2_9HYPH|nr:hypothetical protein [Aureimonas leprariae]KAB0679757.1 hypothetical protein F6X38_11035 [Aureimonas leprariae]
MFTSFARGALVALAVGAGFVGASAVPASATSILIDDGGVRVVEPVQYRDYDRRDDFRRDRYFGDRGGFCSPRLALRKAYDIGLNRPRVVGEGRRFVIVDGFRRGRIATVRFANDRGCPVLGVRR